MYLGFDIGGTSVKYGILDEKHNIVMKSSFDTPKASAEKILEKIAEITNKHCAEYEIKSVGIGAPGYVDPANGVIIKSGNLPFENTEVVKYISEKVQIPVFLGNDANCAALGEFYAYGTKAVNSVMITLGTGIGGGMIINGKLYTANNGLAGEIGHMTIVQNGKKCPCGKRGCYEKYASANALVELTRDSLLTYPDSELSHDFMNSPEKINGKTIFEYVRKGSKIAEKTLTKYIGYLVTGLENIVDILQPDEIVLAGGITNEDDILMPMINKLFSRRCGIRISGLKNDAGFFGAALLVKQ